MNKAIIAAAEQFVAEQFRQHPHYSFNDWTVMADHSRTVKDLALTISAAIPVDRTVVAIGALLHDIGKTYPADAETLHTKHEDFNLVVSETFLNTLDLADAQRAQIKEIIQHRGDSLEMQIIEDADALALYADKRLYTLYIQWARENRLDAAIQRKLDKFEKLHFPISKEMGRPWYKQMKSDWDL